MAATLSRISWPSFLSVSRPESKSTSPGSEMTIRLWRTFTASPSFVSASSLAFSFSKRALMSSSWRARSL